MIVALTVSLFPSSGMDNANELKSQDEKISKKHDLLNKPDLEGTFFKAIAQESLQSISISKNGIVYTSIKPNQRIVFPFVEARTEGEGRVFVSETKNEEIEIVIYEDETSREFLDGRFDHSVAVRLVRKQELKDIVVDFAGFGYYQYNHELSGNWIFQTFEDKRIEQLNINQIPMICIDTHTRSFSGSGGNYMIYGNIRCEGDFIDFEVIMAPEPKNEEFLNEKELLLVLQECDRFEVNEEFLYLFQKEKLKLSFIKDTY
ncbi:hypothetical protein [Myroides guanonis]|uniref:Uncharacterized protein n=1 Tax=Myroides guanonis TaxID=1150112 RepID=A0A1I3TEC9_9FLAO|nr:hypothetical protein [Myroides guanonis]SFJ69518.1 hypothetical protein SAMN04487893_11356 [Myroides guanonis]